MQEQIQHAIRKLQVGVSNRWTGFFTGINVGLEQWNGMWDWIFNMHGTGTWDLKNGELAIKCLVQGRPEARLTYSLNLLHSLKDLTSSLYRSKVMCI